jgi:hypothetical protein
LKSYALASCLAALNSWYQACKKGGKLVHGLYQIDFSHPQRKYLDHSLLPGCDTCGFGFL